ncbi:MAG: hypothetical protein LCI03_14875 [Actinobacteria bacterium]|nr:hypothetical protein [Actinomycetota bacterium]
MKIGILGRNGDLLRDALDLAEGAGHDARGTLIDHEALAWVRSHHIQALLIGGGVEETSRKVMLAECAQNGVKAVEIAGPGVLGHSLKELAEVP